MTAKYTTQKKVYSRFTSHIGLLVLKRRGIQWVGVSMTQT